MLATVVATETPIGQRELKTPEEEAEAEPTESVVARTVVVIHTYTFQLDFV